MATIVESTRKAELGARASSLLKALPDELVETLATLHGQPSDVVDVVLSTLRYGSRTTLAEADVIERLASGLETGERVTLTPFGEEVIELCASKHGPSATDNARAENELAAARVAWANRTPSSSN